MGSNTDTTMGGTVDNGMDGSPGRVRQPPGYEYDSCEQEVEEQEVEEHDIPDSDIVDPPTPRRSNSIGSTTSISSTSTGISEVLSESDLIGDEAGDLTVLCRSGEELSFSRLYLMTDNRYTSVWKNWCTVLYQKPLTSGREAVMPDTEFRPLAWKTLREYFKKSGGWDAKAILQDPGCGNVDGVAVVTGRAPTFTEVLELEVEMHTLAVRFDMMIVRKLALGYVKKMVAAGVREGRPHYVAKALLDVMPAVYANQIRVSVGEEMVKDRLLRLFLTLLKKDDQKLGRTLSQAELAVAFRRVPDLAADLEDFVVVPR